VTPRHVLLGLLGICAAVASAKDCFGCDSEATEKPTSTCVGLERGGRHGAWFDEKTATELTLARDSAAARTAEAAALREAVAGLLKQRDLLTSAVAEERKIADSSADAADAERALRLSMASESASWYRSPVLWFVVGAAIGGGAVAYIALH